MKPWQIAATDDDRDAVRATLIDGLTACSDHAPDATTLADLRAGAVLLAAAWEDWDSESFAVVRAHDGSYLAASEWSDSSGHG